MRKVLVIFAALIMCSSLSQAQVVKHVTRGAYVLVKGYKGTVRAEQQIRLGLSGRIPQYPRVMTPLACPRCKTVLPAYTQKRLVTPLDTSAKKSKKMPSITGDSPSITGDSPRVSS